MSIRGVFQLLKLNVSYCQWDGSSRVIRSFLEKGLLEEFAAKYPHVDVTTVVRRGFHPFLESKFRNGNVKHVDLRKKTEEEISFQLHYMFSDKGKGTANPIKGTRKFTKTPSVQGVWRPGMWDKKPAEAAN